MVDIDVDNDVSDNDNGFGMPVVMGFMCSFVHCTPNGECRDNRMCIMSSVGMDQLDNRDLHKNKL